MSVFSALRAVQRGKHFRNPGNGSEFQSSRLRKTTRQRSVSAFRVAFRSVQVTRPQARGKLAMARFTLRAPRCSLVLLTGTRSHAETDDRREGAIPSEHVPLPYEGLTEAMALKVFGVLSKPLRYLRAGRFTHWAAIRARLSVRSCHHLRVRDHQRSPLQPVLRPAQGHCIVIGTRAQRRDMLR